MDDGRTTEHGYTISSPCEPDGSGELKKKCSLFLRMLQLSLALIGQWVSEEKIFAIVEDDRRTPEHGHPISSVELK